LKLFTKEPAEPVEKPSTPGKRKSSGTKRDKDIASREVKHHFTFKNYRFDLLHSSLLYFYFIYNGVLSISSF
jgi:hypothetical protein